MNKSIAKQAFLLFLSTGIFVSCMTEDVFSSKEKLSPEVLDAQVWYTHQEKREGIRLTLPGGQKQNSLWPNWRQTFSNEDELCKVTEVWLKSIRKKYPDSDKKGVLLEHEEGFRMTAPECAAKFQETGDNRYMASDVRLIVRTNKETKEKDGFVMIAYPDLSYLEAHIDNPLKGISYLERDKEFSGMITFYDMDGNWMNAWKYINGTAYSLRIREPE